MPACIWRICTPSILPSKARCSPGQPYRAGSAWWTLTGALRTPPAPRRRRPCRQGARRAVGSHGVAGAVLHPAGPAAHHPGPPGRTRRQVQPGACAAQRLGACRSCGKTETAPNALAGGGGGCALRLGPPPYTQKMPLKPDEPCRPSASPPPPPPLPTSHPSPTHPHCPHPPGQVREGQLLVGQEDALYEYTQDTRAGCAAFAGHKQQLALLRRYVVVVGAPPPLRVCCPAGCSPPPPAGSPTLP
jgi:hypothetical protein